MDKQFCPYCMSSVTPGEPCRTCGLTAGSYSPSPHHLPPGTVLRERYLVGRVLGEGGFGITYIGCDLRLELKVAIKEYFPSDRVSRMSSVSLNVTSHTGVAGSGYEEGKTRFLREARTMARMDKLPAIVSVRDFFEVNNTAYIVMEYVEGTTFKDLVEQKGGRIPAGELLRTLEPLFGALGAMHSLGLIHRDISPENLMLEKGEVRLIDFGCAREAAAGQTTMTIALKHGYAPVEQYQSKGQGPWTDVYALAATIYYCLTGIRPPQVMDRLVGDELVPPRKLGVELTEKQERALLRGLSTMQSKRYKSMEEFHTALYTAVQPPPPPPPDILEWLKSHWQVVAGVCAALVVCVTALALALSGGGDPSVPKEPVTPVMNVDAPDTQQPEEPQGGDHAVQVRDEADFLSQLENSGVDAIVVPEGVDFIVQREVVLTKTLRIESGGNVSFYQPLQVAEGGNVKLAGALNCDILLHTAGGTVSVEDGGVLSAAMFWLKSEGDLTCSADGRINVWGDSSDPTKGELDDYARSHYLVMDEEAVFGNAVAVENEEDFAKYRSGSTPIVVKADITFTQPQFDVSAPVLIPEGVTVNFPDEDRCLEFRGAKIVNRGTLQGKIIMNAGESGTAPNALVNFGTVDAEMATDFGTIINQGDLNIYMTLRQTNVVNAGRLTVTGPLELQGNRFVNGGTLSVAKDNLEIYGGTSFNNFGELTVKGNAHLNNYGQLRQCAGKLTVCASGGLENLSYLLVEDAFQGCPVTAEAGGSFVNRGVIQYQEGSMDMAGGAFADEGQMIPFSWHAGWEAVHAQWVGSEPELHAALEDDSVSLVIWDGGSLELKDDLKVSKGLVLDSMGSANTVRFTGGGLTASGEDAFVLLNGVDFGGNPLRVTGGAAVVLDGDNTGLGSVNTLNGGMLCLVGGLRDPVDGGTITLTDGGVLINSAGIELRDCTVQINGGILRTYNSLEMSGCAVENNGFFETNYSVLRTDGGTTLVNNSSMRVIGWGSLTDLGGSITNNGEWFFGGSHLVSGTLRNASGGRMELWDWDGASLRVSGQLENQGSIRSMNGAEIELVDGGVFTGNQISFGE